MTLNILDTKKILIVCDNEERYGFYQVAFSNKAVFEVTYAVSSYTLAKIIKKNGDVVIHIPSNYKNDSKSSVGDIEKSLEFSAGKLSKSTCLSYFSSFYGYLMFGDEFRLNEYDMVVLWNGSRILEKAFVKAREARLQSDSAPDFAFLEISNIPGRLFLDPAGVNAQSLYFLKYKEIALTNKEYSSGDYEEWLQSYIKFKESQVSVSQTKAAKRLYLGPLIDYCMSVLGRSSRSCNIRKLIGSAIGRVVSGTLSKRLESQLTCRLKAESKPYIFLPLQVAGDTQLKINGAGFDNLKAIELVLVEAEKMGCDLIIKIHPSENSYKALIKLKGLLSNKTSVFISQDNTFSLMRGAEKVITINSTVGLEAIILGVKVEILGDSIYSFFESEVDVYHYVFGWLYSLDYFNPKPLGYDFVNEVSYKNEIFRRLSAK